MTIELKKVVSGLKLWDVVVNGIQVVRFATKWQAQAWVNENCSQYRSK